MRRTLPAGTDLACKTCHMKVGKITAPDGRTWYSHVNNPDRHAVEAIVLPEADIRHVCDFCLAADPAWAIPLLERASSLSTVHPGLGVRIRAEDMDAWWGACDTCKDLIETRQIGKLRDQALAAIPERYKNDEWQRQSVITQLAAFWLARPGPAVPAADLELPADHPGQDKEE